MANKYSIQYVNFYTDGSSAKKIAPVRNTAPAELPRPKKHKRRVIYVDPVASLGILVAVCLLVMMCVGLARLSREQAQAQAMAQYVEYLDERNRELTEQYNTGYDLKEVERTALALGMTPRNEVPQLVVHIPAEEMPVEPPKITLLTRLSTLISGLFA